MGITIGVIVIAVVTEAVFTSYSLITRSYQTRLKSWLRLALLVAFVLATLTSLLWWGLRWYGLAALLLIWAVFGVGALLGRRAKRQAFSPWRSVFGAIGRLLLVVIVLTPAILFPQVTLPKPTGTQQVATKNYTFTDPNRIETFTNTGEHRKINVGCWYPQDAGSTYPLLVFSHGAFGMKGGNVSTFTNLASNGYVVCSIDHPYHSLFTVDTEGHRTIASFAFVQEVLDNDNGKFDRATSFAHVKQWMALRVDDMRFVLNTLLVHAQNPGDDPVYQRIDRAHIGLFGHSLGGATSAYIARERGDIGAVIDIDGSLFGEVTDEGNGNLVVNQTIFPVPILVIYSDALGRNISAEHDPDGINPVNRIVATAPHAYKVHVKGHHLNVTDLPLISPVLASLIIAAAPGNGGESVDASAAMEQTNQLVLTFFNVYLKHEGSFSSS